MLHEQLARFALRHVRYLDSIGSQSLKMSQHGGFARRHRQHERSSVGLAQLQPIGPISLRPVDRDAVLAFAHVTGRAASRFCCSGSVIANFSIAVLIALSASGAST